MSAMPYSRVWPVKIASLWCNCAAMELIAAYIYQFNNLMQKIWLMGNTRCSMTGITHVKVWTWIAPFFLLDWKVVSCHLISELMALTIPGIFSLKKNGIYAGKYLSYELYGKSTPGRVRLQSAKAKRPMTWEVKTLYGNRVTLEAVRPVALYCMLWMSTNFRKWDHCESVALCVLQSKRANCCPAKLSYLKDCKSRSVALSRRGLLTWDLKKYSGRDNVYAVFATVRSSLLYMWQCDLEGN